MVDLSGITSSMMGWAKSGAFWIIGILILVLVVFYFYAVMNRKAKLKYNNLEIIRFGNGKVGVNIHKAGIFKSHTAFFGLIDYGNESMFRNADGRRIIGARTSQLHDIFGKKGFITIRKSDDNKILVPISKVQIDNLQALLEIAPADFRDTSTNIIKDTIKETAGTWEKILPYLAIGVIVVLCIISIIINQQMTNNTVDKVGKLLIQGCSNAGASKPAGSP
jgi:hypothetical protein